MQATNIYFIYLNIIIGILLALFGSFIISKHKRKSTTRWGIACVVMGIAGIAVNLFQLIF